MLTEIYILFIIDLMIPHNGMNSINNNNNNNNNNKIHGLFILAREGLKWALEACNTERKIAEY